MHFVNIYMLYKCKIYSSLLINDLCDHLPIFNISEKSIDQNNNDYHPMYIRNINKNTLQNFKFSCMQTVRMKY